MFDVRRDLGISKMGSRLDEHTHRHLPEAANIWKVDG